MTWLRTLALWTLGIFLAWFSMAVVFTGCRKPPPKKPESQVIVVERRGCLVAPPPKSPGGVSALLPGESGCPDNIDIAACVYPGLVAWVEEIELYAHRAWQKCGLRPPAPTPAGGPK